MFFLYQIILSILLLISPVVILYRISINKESKENGELYDSIKPKEISAAILSKMKTEVKPSQIILKENLNKIGVYKADISLHSEVSAEISIKIDKIQSA